MLCNRILFLSIPYGEETNCVRVCDVLSYVVQTNGIDNYRIYFPFLLYIDDTVKCHSDV